MAKEESISDRINAIREATSLNSAFDLAKSFKDISAIKTIYEARTPSFNFVSPYEPLPWQQSLLEELTSTSVFKLRKIIWYYDRQGGCGKSIFCDLAEVKFGHKLMTFANLGKTSDLANLIATRTSKDATPSIFILDLSRANEDRDSVYSFAESLANGRLTSTKYAGAELRFKTEHIVIFANFLPEVSKMSLDRWDIRSLSRAYGNLTVTPMSVSDTLKVKRDDHIVLRDLLAGPQAAPSAGADPLSYLPVFPRQ
jgi:hypothetical protein